MPEKIPQLESANIPPVEMGAVDQVEEIPSPEDETSRHIRGVKRFIEGRVLGVDMVLDAEEPVDSFNDLSVPEKVNLLYEKIRARQAVHKEQSEDSEPIDPYLIAEIRSLWSDERVQEVSLARFAEARADAKAYKLSDLGTSWNDLNLVIAAKEKQYEQVTRNLFLQKITREDRLSSAKTRAAWLAKDLIEKRQTREDIVSLTDLPQIPENTDAAALIHYDRLQRMHEQAVTDGFVWLPSREKIYHKTIGALQNGRWPILKGEAGTGKSELADAAAIALTGESPTHVACGPRTGDRDLIMDKDIDPETGGSYDAYKPLMQAATGFNDSREDVPPIPQGRVVRLDEYNRLDQGGSAYSILKEARQLRPGSMFHDKKVLPGFSAIGTANPPGPRYPDRKEPDAAMRRETADIMVDYPPMSKEEPELYEFILATLMDKNGHITVAGEELAPAYKRVVHDVPIQKKIEQKNEMGEVETLWSGFVSAEEQLVADSASLEHGYAWRLSFAIRAVQDAFNYGNAQEIPDGALRYNVDASTGVLSVVGSGGEPLTLRSSTITLGEIASWMKGYQERNLKDNTEFQTESFSEWIQYKLGLYIDQADSEDKAKLELLFSHFKVLSGPPVNLKNAKPLIPKEIGYLSPRVPRPFELASSQPEEKEVPETTTEVEDVKHELHETTSLLLEDGTQVLVRPRSYQIPHEDGQIYLSPGSRFRIDEGWVAFAGLVEDPSRPDENGQLVVRVNVDDSSSGLHKLLSEQEIAERGEEFWPFASENFTHEKMAESYELQLKVLEETGVTEMLSSGELGIKGVDGKEYPVPSLDMVLERVMKNQEMLRGKVEQGFSELWLVPFAKSIGDSKQVGAGTSTSTHYAYTGLASNYVDSMRKMAKANGDKLLGERANPSDPKELLDFDSKQSLYMWQKIQDADLPTATEKMVYYPKAYAAEHGGKTKGEILADSSEAGWDIILTQDLAVIPTEGEGISEGNRPPMEASGVNPYIPMDPDESTPSINEYLEAIQNPSLDSPYKNESGLTPESWLTMAIHKMYVKGEVMDDYAGKGKISYLVGSYLPTAGGVPSAYFNRDLHQADLYGNVPDGRNDYCGVRSAVRVP